MKQILFIASLLIGLQVSANEYKEYIDKMFNDVIKHDIEFNKEMVEGTEGMQFEKSAKALEKEIGDEWIEILKLIKKSPNNELREKYIRYHLKQSIADAIYDAEYSESIVESTKFLQEFERSKQELKKFEEKLKHLKQKK